ncbi:MAG: hypothetical protein MZW92_09520 [Comamonadaceae bacterium]|nr:hypothetical protein [Comamonadaceae bacterium]
MSLRLARQHPRARRTPSSARRVVTDGEVVTLASLPPPIRPAGVGLGRRRRQRAVGRPRHAVARREDGATRARVRHRGALAVRRRPGPGRADAGHHRAQHVAPREEAPHRGGQDQGAGPGAWGLRPGDERRPAALDGRCDGRRRGPGPRRRGARPVLLPRGRRAGRARPRPSSRRMSRAAAACVAVSPHPPGRVLVAQSDPFDVVTIDELQRIVPDRRSTSSARRPRRSRACSSGPTGRARAAGCRRLPRKGSRRSARPFERRRRRGRRRSCGWWTRSSKTPGAEESCRCLCVNLSNT